uniref:Putative secreted protein n=1 Tax=Anopheles darlingi TaxID=43151 RepID=A0A2M4DFE3_ANODA
MTTRALLHSFNHCTKHLAMVWSLIVITIVLGRRRAYRTVYRPLEFPVLRQRNGLTAPTDAQPVWRT